MAVVALRFPPLPEHVRVARLVAASVVRLAGADETSVDEVRQAVGEACARAVRLHVTAGSDSPVLVELSQDEGQLSVVVRDRGPAPTDLDGLADAPDLASLLVDAEGDSSDSLPAGFRLAVLTGLVDDVAVDRDGDETAVRMSWSLVPAALPA